MARRMGLLRRGRSRGGKFQIARKAWVTSVFNETALTRDGINNEFVLLEAADWQGDTAQLQKHAHVKRIIVSGVVTATPESTTLAFDSIAIFTAMYVADVEDTDTTIITAAAGTILQGNRVLGVKAYGYNGAEIPAAVASQPYIPGVQVEYDVRLNVVVRPDEFLLLGIQYGSAVNGVLNNAAFSGYCRVLMEAP